MEGALYGPEGFYRTQSPERHFRTSVHASPLFAEALARLLVAVDTALGGPARLDFVDMGAGDGTLAERVLAAVPPGVRERTRAVAVEVELSARREVDGLVWATAPPERITGLVIANEWLDNVPLDVVERTPDGPRTVLVDGRGREALGPPPCPEDLAWLERWWPDGDRAEVGRARDLAWAGLVAALEAGVAVAVDYAHDATTRRPTLTGYRDGHVVTPMPDGTCDITAHVALDSAAEAARAVADARRADRPEGNARDVAGRADGPGSGVRAGAVSAATRPAGETAPTSPGRDASEACGVPATPSPWASLETVLTTQRAALHALGVSGARPSRELAEADPRHYLRMLARAGEAAELTDPAGLGGFGWLMQSRGVELDMGAEFGPGGDRRPDLTG